MEKFWQITEICWGSWLHMSWMAMVYFNNKKERSISTHSYTESLKNTQVIFTLKCVPITNYPAYILQLVYQYYFIANFNPKNFKRILLNMHFIELKIVWKLNSKLEKVIGNHSTVSLLKSHQQIKKQNVWRNMITFLEWT